MMGVAYEYFKSKNYEIVLEPRLNYGRADLGFYQKNKKPTYVEVGTVSLFKLWYNILSMENATFLIVTSENYLIELKSHKNI